MDRKKRNDPNESEQKTLKDRGDDAKKVIIDRIKKPEIKTLTGSKDVNMNNAETQDRGDLKLTSLKTTKSDVKKPEVKRPFNLDKRRDEKKVQNLEDRSTYKRTKDDQADKNKRTEKIETNEQKLDEIQRNIIRRSTDDRKVHENDKRKIEKTVDESKALSSEKDKRKIEKEDEKKKSSYIRMRNATVESEKRGVKIDSREEGGNSNLNAKEVNKESRIEENKDTNEEKESIQRKPIIRTITSKNDTVKIYKAVTFVDHKKNSPTPLQIKIPSDLERKSKIPKPIKPVKSKHVGSITNLNSKPNATKKERYKKFKKIRRNSSPDILLRKDSPPPTEVAKWAPSSIDKHTKPYYEAWVNTTLTAISKITDQEKRFFEKQNLIKTIQRAMEERIDSPDLTYSELKDEKYAGRIKIRQKTSQRNTL